MLHGQVEQAEAVLGLALGEHKVPPGSHNLHSSNADPAVWLTRAIARYLCAKHEYQTTRYLEGARHDLEHAEKLLSVACERDCNITWPHFHYAKGQVLCQLGEFEQSAEQFTKGKPVDTFLN
ncbi:unnamed protein product [Echinostoma caproni]|uniref:TPR_REGION domain-containing protein n=1 Tax=Echinostoma caproni TaxID=27848 RepID=A0A3P8BQ45_9TREM|nr:unnamed protein product [Echinostoma caproni]